jgi:two-component system sensor histidine kinase ChvG
VKAALEAEDDPRALQAVRLDKNGNIVLSVAAPVKQIKGLVGAVRLYTRDSDFNNVLRAEFMNFVGIFFLAFVANIILAGGYAAYLIIPIKRLAAAADRVRTGRQKPGKASRAELPGFEKRPDEIGDLAASLNDMTRALNTRLDAIEAFAADVSHEIKTPLTSIRSAVETLDIAKTEESRLRLIEVIKHDVDRLDRLITDISNASRLDAELSREEATTIYVPALLDQIVSIYHDSGSLGDIELRLDVQSGARDPGALKVLGIESRLGQVVQNLIVNAVSFSPPGGTVHVRAGLERPGILPLVSIRVEDQGPGIPEDSLEKIFQRFYTSRPSAEDFGKNSGLGLSISKQIIEAHSGRIWAENMRDQAGNVTGARFTVLIPPGEGPQNGK